MRKRLIFILLIGICFAWMGRPLCSGGSSGFRIPQPEKGVLDLRDWDPPAQGPVTLNGSWEFYWERLYGPEDFVNGNPPGKREYLTVPGSWNGQEVAGRKIPGMGYATYRLRVLMKPNRDPLAFKFLSLGTSFVFYVNGKKTASAGRSEKTVKFTPEGGMVKLEAQGRGGQGFEITVSDNGIGLKETDLERIFYPFEQVDGSADRMYQGTGLGLSLTKRMVELHGGRIWAESAGLGKGSRVHIFFPINEKMN